MPDAAGAPSKKRCGYGRTRFLPGRGARRNSVVEPLLTLRPFAEPRNDVPATELVPVV
jgi:hypothetical protein